jgi:predicted glycoside hydrolase/deacetylase ChbG (UPF0249 family)
MPSAQATRLIVHADDFGETREITKGIRDCLDAGVVTSTSILANMPGTALALDEAARRGRAASFGVHLNLCEGSPLTQPASTLGSEGSFLPKRALALRALLGRLDLSEVARELRTQIALVRDAGVQISHLDSHKHLHQLPGVARVVAGLANEFGIRRIRCTLGEPLRASVRAPVRTVSELARAVCARRARAEFAVAKLRHPDRTIDLRSLMATTRERGAQFLGERPGAIVELMCHPGTESADVEKPGSCARYAEYRFLRSPRFQELLADSGARLVTYWEC